jgi:hypothetical protein
MVTDIERRTLSERRAKVVTASEETPLSWGFPEFFVISQTAFPAILYLPGTQALRLPLRVATFGISLVALGIWFAKRKKKLTPHPATYWLILAIVCLCVMIFHPTTNTALAGLAQTLLYMSVLAPVFWASEMVTHPKQLSRLLLLLLLCNGINSLVGVLQVYDPDTWMPQEFSSVIQSMKYGLGSFTYIGADGKLVVRPPGLFDTPGAVCGAGMLAGLLGIAFFIHSRNLSMKIIALVFAALGISVIYLSQVRTALLIMGVMVLAYFFVIGFIQKHRVTATVSLGLAALLLVVGFSFTSLIGGRVVSKRFSTLAQGDPLTVYYQAKRGEQMENTITTLLPEYPFGAGLGRWGMMRLYFGDESNIDSPSIWAELQIPAWLLDGGIILIILYGAALVVTASYELRIAKSSAIEEKEKGSELSFAAAAVIAANIGTLALVFGFTPFTTQIGMQYWFLAGALHGVVQANNLFKNENLSIGQRRFYDVGRHGPR